MSTSILCTLCLVFICFSDFSLSGLTGSTLHLREYGSSLLDVARTEHPLFKLYELSYHTTRFVSWFMSSQLGLSRDLANSWFGLAICYIAIMGIYYSNTWNVRQPFYTIDFPLTMIITSLWPSLCSLLRCLPPTERDIHRRTYSEAPSPSTKLRSMR